MAENTPIEREDVILIASRILALLLLVWALLDLAALPEQGFSLIHYRILINKTPHDVYMSHLYLIATITLALKILALLATVEWLWKCGPKVEGLFSPKSSGQELGDQP